MYSVLVLLNYNFYFFFLFYFESIYIFCDREQFKIFSAILVQSLIIGLKLNKPYKTEEERDN